MIIVQSNEIDCAIARTSTTGSSEYATNRDALYVILSTHSMVQLPMTRDVRYTTAPAQNIERATHAYIWRHNTPHYLRDDPIFGATDLMVENQIKSLLPDITHLVDGYDSAMYTLEYGEIAVRFMRNHVPTIIVFRPPGATDGTN